MCHSGRVSARVLGTLVLLDNDLAYEMQAGGCALCGAPLHRASYPRKPRGLPDHDAEAMLRRRTSFCCSNRDCRRRATPPSLVFLDRRVYVGVVVTLLTMLAHGATPKRLARISEEYAVDRRTLDRWRRWWTTEMPRLDVWRVLRGRFVEQPEEARLPLSLYERMVDEKADEHTDEGNDAKLTKLLTLLRELGRSALMRARYALAPSGMLATRRERSNR